MKVYHDISLTSYNTFGLNATAKNFIELTEVSELNELSKSDLLNSNYYILAGGSNILFSGDYNGTIIHPLFKGIEVLKSSEENVWVKVMAGVLWDEFVEYCVKNDFGGLENLSLIPGHCGAAPVQNIGAFGVEIKDHLIEVEIINIITSEKKTLRNTDCDFGYRNSIFKNELKKSWMIISSTYKLTKRNHLFKLNYGNISDELKNYSDTNLKNIRQAVINIRTSKLPDPKIMGNAGSFFKNPMIDINDANRLKVTYPEIPLYPVSETQVKLAAGWLIDQCGWKGRTFRNAGVHEKQALVIVNRGNAVSKDIIQLSEEIKKSVFNTFGVALETEVNFV